MFQQDVYVGHIPTLHVDRFQIGWMKLFKERVRFRPAARQGFSEIVVDEVKSRERMQRMELLVSFFNAVA